MLVERLIAQFGARAWEVALSQRNQATGEARATWSVIADSIAADPTFADKAGD